MESYNYVGCYICTNQSTVCYLDGANCEDILDLKTLLMVLIACSGIASLVSFIATYVSCSAMCNQEQVCQYLNEMNHRTVLLYLALYY